MPSTSHSTATTLGELPGYRRLSPVAGKTWAEVLAPLLRDTAGVSPEHDLDLEFLDWLVDLTRKELDLHPLPRFALLVPPTDAEASADALYFASAVVAHRAERLLQLMELSGTALANLAVGSLQVAAIAARALLEIAAASNKVHADLYDVWAGARSSRHRLAEIATDRGGDAWQAISRSRFGTRNDAWLDFGYPKATNAMTAINRADKRAPGIMALYGTLCEATHPNVEANAAFWRTSADKRLGGLPHVEFTPTRSQSPVKTAVVEATKFSTWVILNYCRDSWWIACDLVTSGVAQADRDTAAALGMPVKGPRNEACMCGSGQKAKLCPHPPTRHVLEEWNMRRSVPRHLAPLQTDR